MCVTTTPRTSPIEAPMPASPSVSAAQPSSLSQPVSTRPMPPGTASA
jgi:hypothetical protein